MERKEKEIDAYEMRAKIFNAMMEKVDAEVAKVQCQKGNDFWES